MPDSSGAVDLNSLPPEDQERLAKMAEENETEPEIEKMEVDTAFLVFWTKEGNVAVAEYDGEHLLLQRRPTDDLIYAAVTTVAKDLTAQETASAGLNMQVQYAHQLQQQQQAAQVAQGLDLSKLRGGH